MLRSICLYNRSVCSTEVSNFALHKIIHGPWEKKTSILFFFLLLQSLI